jgi:putative endonuclease
MSYFIYILKSVKHQTYYYGSTKDITERFKEHNAGRVRYTKGRKPWNLHYIEECETRSEAVKREKFFKTVEGYRYLKDKKII